MTAFIKANYKAMNLTSSDYVIKQLCNIGKMSAIMSHMIFLNIIRIGHIQGTKWHFRKLYKLV